MELSKIAQKLLISPKFNPCTGGYLLPSTVSDEFSYAEKEAESYLLELERSGFLRRPDAKGPKLPPGLHFQTTIEGWYASEKLKRELRRRHPALLDQRSYRLDDLILALSSAPIIFNSRMKGFVGVPDVTLTSLFIYLGEWSEEDIRERCNSFIGERLLCKNETRDHRNGIEREAVELTERGKERYNKQVRQRLHLAEGECILDPPAGTRELFFAWQSENKPARKAHRDTDGANESAKLEPVHQRIIDFTYRHWLEEGGWPEKVKIKATLRTEGFNRYNEIESVVLEPYLRRWTDEKVELTILGFHSAAGTAEWMGHFVDLVNQSVERYLEDPKGEPVVTDAHLAAIANDWSQEKLLRYGEIYRDWISTLGGGSGTDKDGHWTVRLGPSCIRYIGLKSITDFASRRRDYKYTTLKDGLTPDQRKMAVWCIRRWRTPEGAPAAIDVVLHHVGVVENPLDAWESMPQEVFDDARVYAEPPQPIKPRLGGLLALRPETNEDLLSFWKVTRSVRDLYLDKKAPNEVSIADVAGGAELSEEDVVRLAGLASTAVALDFFPNSRQGHQFISTYQRLFDLDGIDSLDGLLNYLDQQWTRMEDRGGIRSLLRSDGEEMSDFEDPAVPEEPKPKVLEQSTDRTPPSWLEDLPRPIQTLLTEVYAVLGVDARTLANMGARAIVDAVIYKEVGDRGSFVKGIEALVADGHVAPRDKDIILAVVDSGHASSHRGHTPEVGEVNIVLDIIENVLQRIYVLGRQIETLKQKTPQRVRGEKTTETSDGPSSSLTSNDDE